jgi:large subunit ribosomal protein L22
MKKMNYTFKPKQKFAKASGKNLKISTKKAAKICRIIRGKKLTQVKRLLDDLLTEKRSISGKYYTKAAKQIKMLLESCEKNADFLGLNTDALFVHASASHGNIMRRRRRKSGFGSRMKSTNLEIMLIEKGKFAARKENGTEKKKGEAKKEQKEKQDVSAKVNSGENK